MEAYRQFEEEFGRWAGVENVVACSSGTAALHLALEALQLPQGSEVVVPDFTMIACARAVTLAGLTPVFVDCDERLNMDWGLADQAAAEIGGPMAVMAVHVYGRRCEMDRLAHTCDDNEPCWLIEDLAEAHGVRPHPRTDAACWSFYKNKIIAGEEGGAVAFKNPEHAALARQLRSLGFTDDHDFRHVPRGHNYRISNAHADLIRQSLRNVGNFPGESRWMKSRWALVRLMNELCPPEWKMPPRDAPWVYDLRIPGLCAKVGVEGQNRIVAALNAEGIAARHFFKPMHCQEEYKNCRVVAHGWSDAGGPSRLTNALVASTEGIYLPIRPGVTTRESCRLAFEVIWDVVGK